jgi:two-component system sensor histidine kinase/response regulator
MDTREIESGFVKLNIQPFGLRRVIDENHRPYQLLAEEKTIVLTTDLPDEDEIRIEADRTRIARALANLVDNALKYTPGRRRPNRVVVRRRNGDRPRRRQRHRHSRKRTESRLAAAVPGRLARESQKGLGLGLNIVQVIVAAHGGTVSFQSVVGKGTTFEVTLPARPNRARKKRSGPPSEAESVSSQDASVPAPSLEHQESVMRSGSNTSQATRWTSSAVTARTPSRVSSGRTTRP